jgi:tRNA(fMet)-specific endonuclease VapC
VAEVYEGAFHTNDPPGHLATLRAFLAPYPVVQLDDDIAERFAEVRSLLRHQGQIISDFDLVLAATALHHGLTVLTFNLRHLSRVPGLNLFPVS